MTHWTKNLQPTPLRSDLGVDGRCPTCAVAAPCPTTAEALP